ncbi:MAG: hypothetical protein ACETWT_00350 [Thermodesulfobacteriota bacterium]
MTKRRKSHRTNSLMDHIEEVGKGLTKATTDYRAILTCYGDNNGNGLGSASAKRDRTVF